MESFKSFTCYAWLRCMARPIVLIVNSSLIKLVLVKESEESLPKDVNKFVIVEFLFKK